MAKSENIQTPLEEWNEKWNSRKIVNVVRSEDKDSDVFNIENGTMEFLNNIINYSIIKYKDKTLEQVFEFENSVKLSFKGLPYNSFFIVKSLTNYSMIMLSQIKLRDNLISTISQNSKILEEHAENIVGWVMRCRCSNNNKQLLVDSFVKVYNLFEKNNCTESALLLCKLLESKSRSRVFPEFIIEKELNSRTFAANIFFNMYRNELSNRSIFSMLIHMYVIFFDKVVVDNEVEDVNLNSNGESLGEALDAAISSPA